MKAVIATNNEVKVQCAKNALLRYWKNVEVIGIYVPSDVSNQPINEEIYDGAKNRISNLKRYCKENNINADLYLSIESGISNQLGEWQVISLAMIENNIGISSFSTTAGFPIPERYIDDVVNKGVGYVTNKLFGSDTEYKGIQLLTNGVLTRGELMEEAFVLGLIKIIHKGKWQ